LSQIAITSRGQRRHRSSFGSGSLALPRVLPRSLRGLFPGDPQMKRIIHGALDLVRIVLGRLFTSLLLIGLFLIATGGLLKTSRRAVTISIIR
jgi:hypothetical protein